MSSVLAYLQARGDFYTRNSMSKKSKSPTLKQADKKQQGGRVRVEADVLPRRALPQCVAIIEELQKTFAGGPATYDQLCEKLDLGSTSPNTKYLFWSAKAYGILIENEQGGYSISEAGRKIAAPTYDKERSEGIVKAVLTPTLLSQFFSDYNGYQIPTPDYFANILEQKYKLPRARAEEAIETILTNGRYAGLLIDDPTGGPARVMLPGSPVPPAAVLPMPDILVVDSASDATKDWSKTCFYITPLGGDESEERKHADMMLKHLIDPVLKDFGFSVVRADKIERSGVITRQIFEHIARCGLCVADLSFGNENVFYELGVRHTMLLPAIQLIRTGDRIPFDVSQGRTIKIDTSDRYTIMDRIESGRRELSEHVKHILAAESQDSGEDNPVRVYLPAFKVAAYT